MMGEWSDRAIILRLGLFHESDIWLKVLTREHGLATVFAFGGAKSLRRFCGCLDLLNTLECRIKSSRNGNFLNLLEASLVSGPVRLREDWRRMGMAANCMRFLEIAGEDAAESRKFFALLEDLRDALDGKSAVSQFTPVLFRFAVAVAAGFGPDLDFCGECGQKLAGNSRFAPAEGRFVCQSCLSGPIARADSIFVTRAALGLLREAARKPPREWPAGEDRATASICGQVVEQLLSWHMGIEFGASGFTKAAALNCKFGRSSLSRLDLAPQRGLNGLAG